MAIKKNKKILSILLIMVLTVSVSCGQQKSGETGSQNDDVENVAQVSNTAAEYQQQQETPLNGQALHEAVIKAIRTDDHPAFDRLISQNPEIDVLIPFEEPDYVDKEYTLLGFACKFKRCRMAKHENIKAQVIGFYGFLAYI